MAVVCMWGGLVIVTTFAYDLPLEQAYIDIQQNKKMPVHYTAYFPDVNSLEWFRNHHQQELVRVFMCGTLLVTGHTRLVVNAK
jgi:hypothetical protein